MFSFTNGYFTYLNSIKISELENKENRTNLPQFIKHHYYNHSNIRSIIEKVISKNNYNVTNSHKDFIIKQVQNELSKNNNQPSIPNAQNYATNPPIVEKGEKGRYW